MFYRMILDWKIFGFFIRRKILRPLIRSRVKSSSFNDISMNGISLSGGHFRPNKLTSGRKGHQRYKNWNHEWSGMSHFQMNIGWSRDQYTKHHTYSRLRRSINAAQVIRGHFRSNELLLMIIWKKLLLFGRRLCSTRTAWSLSDDPRPDSRWRFERRQTEAFLAQLVSASVS